MPIYPIWTTIQRIGNVLIDAYFTDRLLSAKSELQWAGQVIPVTQVSGAQRDSK